MICAYVVEKPHGKNNEGDLVHMDSEDAKALCKAGVLREAEQDDLNNEGQEQGADDDQDESKPNAPLQPQKSVEKTVDTLVKRIEDSLVKATEKIAEKNATVINTRPDLTATAKDNQHGFKDFNEFLHCIVAESRGNNGASQKLASYCGSLGARKPTVEKFGKGESTWSQKSPLGGADETTLSEGGYSVIPAWASSIWDKARSKFNLLDFCTEEYAAHNTNTINLPSINETSLVDGQRFGGIVSAWAAEGAVFNASKAAYTQTQLILNKLYVFMPFTNELLSDSSYPLQAKTGEYVGTELAFMINKSIIQGSGSGQPLGLVNLPCLVTVAKESGQANASVVYQNMTKMYTRLYQESYDSPKLVWLVTQQIYSQLLSMVFPTVAGTFPVGGLSFNAQERYKLAMFGVPILIMPQSPQLGLLGDIILSDMSQYHFFQKPLQVAVSTDFAFNQDITIFRWTYRLDGKSPWTAALTPNDASANTTSPVVALAARGT